MNMVMVRWGDHPRSLTLTRLGGERGGTPRVSHQRHHPRTVIDGFPSPDDEPNPNTKQTSGLDFDSVSVSDFRSVSSSTFDSEASNNTALLAMVDARIRDEVERRVEKELLNRGMGEGWVGAPGGW